MKKLTFLLVVFTAFVSCKKEDKPSQAIGIYTGFGIIDHDYYSFDLGYWVNMRDSSYNWSFAIFNTNENSATVSFSVFKDTVSVGFINDSLIIGDVLVFRNGNPCQTCAIGYDYNLKLKGDSLVGSLKYSGFPPSKRTYSIFFTKQ